MFSAIIGYIKNELAVLWGDVKKDAEVIAPEALATLDAFIAQFLSAAVAAVKQANLTDLSSPAKREQVFSSVANDVEATGTSVEKQGVTAAINLVIEYAVNFVKLAEGQSITPVG